MAQYKLIGVYRITPTQESIVAAARYHKYDWLINDQGEFIEEILWENFKHLSLLEVQVFGEFSPSDLNTVSQNDQSPYMEFYLDPTGIQLITEGDAASIEGRRTCFFLHFVDTSKPLRIGSQETMLPPTSNLPNRLVPFAHYVPVD